MTRKLLPYEYELIDTLGVSKEEYLDFLAVQQTYIDLKEGTAFQLFKTEDSGSSLEHLKMAEKAIDALLKT
jgi:hypothetical protein